MNVNEARTLASEAAEVVRARSSARPHNEHISLGGPLRLVIFLLAWALGSGVGAVLGLLMGGAVGLPVGVGIGAFCGFIFGAWASRVVRVAAQWERGVVLRLGKFHALKG